MRVLDSNFNISGAGYNTSVNPYLNKPDESREALNCDTSEIGTLKRFPGYATYGNDLGSTSILGLYDYKTSTGDKKWLAVFATDIYYDNAGTWMTTSSTLTTGKNAEFATHLDTLIMVNGTDAPLKSTNGTSFSALGGSPPTAKYILTFDNKVYMLNLTGNTSRMQWSDDGTIETWTATNIQDIITNIGIGDQITGGAVNSNSLLIFKNYSTWRWDTYSLKVLSPSIGARSPRSIVTLDDRTFFLSHKGVYACDGSRPFRISKKVQDFIDGITDFTACVGWTEYNFYYLYIGTSNGVTNCVLIYDNDADNWSYKSLGVVPKVATILTTSPSTRNMYFGDSFGQVYKFKTGNNDNGAEIPFKYRSPLLLSSAPHKIKSYEYLYVFMDRDSEPGVQVYYSVDFEQFKILGIASKSVSELPFPSNTRGHNIQIMYASNHSKAHQDIYGHMLMGEVLEDRLVGGVV